MCYNGLAIFFFVLAGLLFFFMTVANYLTFIRIFVSPVFLVVYLEHEWLGISDIALPYVLLFLMGVSELSDAFDGYLARRLGQVTDFGKIVDPMADSLARLTYLLSFTAGAVKLPILLVFVFLYRDAVISTLRTLCALRGFALAARPSGKVKAVIQGIAVATVLVMMIPHSLGYLSTEVLRGVAIAVVGVAAVFTVGSGTEYIIANRATIGRLLFEKQG